MTDERPARRVPRQARAERRVEAVLDAAAAVIAEKGYEAATLTEIAQRAQTSIGSLYQYFPDKPAVGAALAERFGGAIGDLWAARTPALRAATDEGLIYGIIDLVLEFHAEHPAYLALISGLRDYRHPADDRRRLRENIAELIDPRLAAGGDTRASAVAEMVVQTVKSLAIAVDRAADRDAIVAEYRLMLHSYLHAVLAQR